MTEPKHFVCHNDANLSRHFLFHLHLCHSIVEGKAQIRIWLFTNEPIRARISPEKSNEESQVLTGVKGAEFDSFQSIKFIDNGV
jgi:hypothetical protein